MGATNCERSSDYSLEFPLMGNINVVFVSFRFVSFSFTSRFHQFNGPILDVGYHKGTTKKMPAA